MIVLFFDAAAAAVDVVTVVGVVSCCGSSAYSRCFVCAAAAVVAAVAAFANSKPTSNKVSSIRIVPISKLFYEQAGTVLCRVLRLLTYTTVSHQVKSNNIQVVYEAMVELQKLFYEQAAV